MDITTILAVYGSGISTILLVYEIIERSKHRRSLLVRLNKHISLNPDQENYHSGRKGNQYLQIKITNKSFQDNSVEEIWISSFNTYFLYTFLRHEVKFNFPHDRQLPFKLSYTEQTSINFPLNMLTHEYNTSWKNNIEQLQELKYSYIRVLVLDTQGKEYQSNMLRLKDLIKMFYEDENKLTSENYRNNNYRK